MTEIRWVTSRSSSVSVPKVADTETEVVVMGVIQVIAGRSKYVSVRNEADGSD